MDFTFLEDIEQEKSKEILNKDNSTQTLLTEILKGYEYVLPKDKEQLLYDFYMSTLFTPTTRDDDMNAAIEDTKQKLYPLLKRELLEAVLYAIMAELRHTLDEAYTRGNLTSRGFHLPEKREEAKSQ